MKLTRDYRPAVKGKTTFIIRDVAVWDALFFEAMCSTADVGKRARLVQAWIDHTGVVRQDDFELRGEEKEFWKMKADFEDILGSKVSQN